MALLHLRQLQSTTLGLVNRYKWGSIQPMLAILSLLMKWKPRPAIGVLRYGVRWS